MNHTANDFGPSPLRSRRWEPGGPGRKTVLAGVECTRCGVECDALWAQGYRCPKCGARANACPSTLSFKACALAAGHDGDHESPSGTTWPRAERGAR